MVRWVRGRLGGARGGRGGHLAPSLRFSKFRHGPPLLRDVEDTEQQEAPDDSIQLPNAGHHVEEAREEANEGPRALTDARTNQPTKKRGRGSAKDTLFERVRKFGPIPLTIKDGQRGPSCENYNIFSGRVTTIVRFHADMRHASWKAVPREEKEELINRVKVDFILDLAQISHRECVTNALARKYNAFHYFLRKQYLRYESHEAAISGGTSWVEKPVWEHLCAHWSSEGFQRMSKRNIKNREKQRVNHTSGRKPFVRIMEEMNDEGTNLIALYRATHWSRKKDRFITDMAERNYNLMLERLEETEVDTSNIDEASSVVFKEVLGHRTGYAIGLGHSVIPEPSIAIRNSRDYQRIVEQSEKNKNEASMYKSQVEVLREEVLEFKNQFKEYVSLMNTRMLGLEGQRESHQETYQDAQDA